MNAAHNVIAANLRSSMPTNHGSKLGYHMAITAVANALSQLDGQAFDRAAFMEAATVRPPKQEPLPLRVTA